MMKSFVRSAAVMVLLGATAACSMFGDKTPAPTSGTIEENVATVTAKVTAVDYDSRLVTIMTNEGESVTFKAGPEVKNLAQVDPGDVIRAQYYESVVYELKKPGEAVPGVQVAEEGAAAPKGTKPGMGAARVVRVTATVQAVDMKAPSVTLRGADGQVTTLPVRDVNRLKAVKAGDLVEFTYTEAMAVTVEELQD